jgi:hypothetical protein
MKEEKGERMCKERGNPQALVKKPSCCNARGKIKKIVLADGKEDVITRHSLDSPSLCWH